MKNRILMIEDLNILIDFRKQFIKEKFIMYFNYGIIKEGILKKEITGLFQNEKIIGYLWLRNLKRKPITKIDEICSNIKGGGRILMEIAEKKAVHNTIELQVVDFNKNAISFYKYFGYSIAGEKQGKKILNIIMRKQINNNINLFNYES